jgi:hypothetical protein
MRHVRISEDMGLTDFTQIEQDVLSGNTNVGGLIRTIGDHNPESVNGFGFGLGARKGLMSKHMARRKKMMGGKKKKKKGAAASEPAEATAPAYGAPEAGAPAPAYDAYGAPAPGAPGAPTAYETPQYPAYGAPAPTQTGGGASSPAPEPPPESGGEGGEGEEGGEGAPEGAPAPEAAAPAPAPKNGAPVIEKPVPTTLGPEHVGPSAALLQAGGDEKPWLKWALIGGGVLAVGLIVYFFVIKKKK